MAPRRPLDPDDGLHVACVCVCVCVCLCVCADHLAQMMELIGPFSRGFALSGKLSRQFFDKNGSLKNIRELNYWPLQQVLADKYRFPKDVAQSIAEFLLPMLEINPLKRASAQQ